MLQVKSDTLQMYLGAPWCLGRVEEFYPLEKNGEQFAHKITLLDHAYVIWADPETNEVFAFDNICPHAGASLGDGGYLTTRTFKLPGQDDLVTKKCLACPYHGHQVQFLEDGRAIIDDKATAKPLQANLPLTVKDGLVWTYGLEWSKTNKKFEPRVIQPRLPIPDYSQLGGLEKYGNSFSLSGGDFFHVSTQSRSVEANLLHFAMNVCDAQHFAEVHKNTMLSQKVKVHDLKVEENRLSWVLELFKRPKQETRESPYDFLISSENRNTYFNSFLPGTSFTVYHFDLGTVIDLVTLYPESLSKTQIRLTTYRNFNFPWYTKLLKAKKKVNQFRMDLISEDTNNLEKVSDNYERKINLAHDEPVIAALKYLQNW